MKNILKKNAFITIAYVLILSFLALPANAQPVNLYWYKPYYDNTASVTLPADDQTDIYFGFKANIDSKYEAVLVKVVLNSDEVYYYYPAKQNTVEGTVYLRFGKGAYQVEINVVKPNPKNPGTIVFERLAKTTIVNTAEGDLRYLLPSWGIESDNQEIIDKANEITRGIKDDYKKAEAIHDWVSKNITYDMEKYKQNRVYDNEGAVKALQTRKGLCRDYSNLTTALFRAIGIEARTVIGEAFTNGRWYGHAWNEVKIGDKWISMDTTWDAGVVTDNKFVPKFSRQYFDPAQKEFDKTHRKTQEVY